MALAWKAGWVQALTSSNLVSSATANCALTRAYTPARAPLGASNPRFVRYLCAIFRGGPLRGGLWRTSRAAPGRRVRSARLAAPEGLARSLVGAVQLEFRAELPSGGPSDSWAPLAGRERESTVQLSRKYGSPAAKVRN